MTFVTIESALSIFEGIIFSRANKHSSHLSLKTLTKFNIRSFWMPLTPQTTYGGRFLFQRPKRKWFTKLNPLNQNFGNDLEQFEYCYGWRRHTKNTSNLGPLSTLNSTWTSRHAWNPWKHALAENLWKTKLWPSDEQSCNGEIWESCTDVWWVNFWLVACKQPVSQNISEYSGDVYDMYWFSMNMSHSRFDGVQKEIVVA